MCFKHTNDGLIYFLMLSDVSLLTPPPSKPPPMIPDRDQTPWAPIILGVKHIHQSSPQRHHHQIHGIGSVCIYLYLSIFVFVFLQWRKSCLISCGWDVIRQRPPNLVCIWGQKESHTSPTIRSPRPFWHNLHHTNICYFCLFILRFIFHVLLSEFQDHFDNLYHKS